MIRYADDLIYIKNEKTYNVEPLSFARFTSANISNDRWAYKPYRVVRVETSTSLNNADNTDKEASPEELSDSQDEPEKQDFVVDPVVGGEEDINKGVARQIGGSVFRGIITKVSNWLCCLALCLHPYFTFLFVTLLTISTADVSAHKVQGQQHARRL